MHIDPFWDDDGKAAAQSANISTTDVISTIDSPSTIVVLVGEGPDSIIWLGGRSKRIIVVTAEREHRNIDAYRITDVRHATQGEVTAWEKRQQ